MAHSFIYRHEIPVKETFKPAVEVELGPGAQQPVPLGGVGHVLEGLAQLAQAGHQLLRLLRAHPLVQLTVGDQQRHLDVLEPVVGRGRAVGRAVRGRRAHHALGVLDALAVALRPRGLEVAVAVLADPAAEAMLGVVGHAGQRHVRPVARPEDRQPATVDPVEGAQEVGARQAVLRVGGALSAVVEPLELPPVAGGAAEVERQPGVPLVDEVLRVAVPLVGVTHRGPAVGIDHRRHRSLGRRPSGPHQEGRDLEPVEGAEDHLLQRRVGRGLDRLRSGGVDRRRLTAGADAAELGRRGVVLVGGDHVALGGPVGRGPQPSLGERLLAAVARVDTHQPEAVAVAPDRQDAGAVGMPFLFAVVGAGGGDLTLVLAVAADQMQLVEPAALRGVGDGGPVGRPGRLAVVHARRAGERAGLAAVDRRQPDLAAVEVGARIEGVGHLGPVGRHDGLALVAVGLQLAVRHCQPPRPGIVELDHRQPGAGVLLPLDGHDQPVVARPAGASPLQELPRRAAGGGGDPHAAGGGVGDRRPVG